MSLQEVGSPSLSSKATNLFQMLMSLYTDTPESVEGLDSAYVVYRLKATIERPRFSQDIHAKRVSTREDAHIQRGSSFC